MVEQTVALTDGPQVGQLVGLLECAMAVMWAVLLVSEWVETMGVLPVDEWAVMMGRGSAVAMAEIVAERLVLCLVE